VKKLSRRPDISFYYSEIVHGGVVEVTRLLANEFISRGYSVDLVFDKPGLIDEYDFSEKARRINLNASKYSIFRIINLIKYLREYKPYCMRPCWHLASELSLLARYLGNKKTKVFIPEELAIFEPIKHEKALMFHIRPFLIKWIHPFADGIIAVSNGLADEVKKLTNIRSNDVNVIFNPVITGDLPDRAKEEICHPWYLEKDLPVITSVARLDCQKDISSLIRVFSKVFEVKESRLVIFGCGSEEAKLRNLAKDCGLEDYIDFPGFVKNVYPYLARTDVFAFSSIYEGFGLTIVEAMAMGVPIVATDCPYGPRDILDNGRYGELVQIGDIDGFSRAILNVLDGDVKKVDPEWLKQFSIESVAEKYLKVMGMI